MADQGEAAVTQPVASSSRNPQLGTRPYFAYPTPPAEAYDEELPPHFEGESAQMGELLSRLSRRGYGDLRHLVDQT